MLFCNSFALEIADVVSMSGFLSALDVSNILLLWIVDATMVMFTAGLQSLVIDRFERKRFFRWMILAIAGAYIILRLLFAIGAPGWFNYALLLVLSDQQWVFFPLIFWVLANDVFGMSQAKRLFPLLIGLGFLGQSLGSAAAASAPRILHRFDVDTVELLSLNAAVYVVAYVVITLGLRTTALPGAAKKTSETAREALSEGWKFIREVASFRYLVVAFIAVYMVITVIRFHFLVVSAAAFPDHGDFQTFYGIYRFLLILSSILTTTFLSGRIMQSVGLKNIFTVTPMIFLLIILAMLGSPSVLVGTAAMIMTWLAFFTIDQPSRKAFQALVPEKRRGRVSLFMDSYIPAAGTIIASIVLGIIVLGNAGDAEASSVAYLIFGGAAAAFAVGSALYLRKVYDVSLLNWRMKRRSRGASVLDKLEF